MDDLISEFLIESYENLDRLDRELIDLEDNPQDRDALASIFRTIHTIKGSCGFLGFTRLESVTHVGENLLSKLRDGELQLTPAMTTALLSMVDAVRTMLTQIETTQTDGEDDYAALIAQLQALQEKGGDAEAPPEGGSGPKDTAGSDPERNADSNSETEKSTSPRVENPPAADDSNKIPAPKDAEPAEPGGAGGAGREKASEAAAAAASPGQSATPKKAKKAPSPDKKSAPAKPSQLAGSAIRVDVNLLDRLMNLVGELVLARNQILQHSLSQDDALFAVTSQRLNLITSELQESVMKTRMQPIGTIWGKFPRVVRDVAMSCGKQVRVEMEGKETEMDKTIIEALKDPLTHVVRNAIDHGIEAPDVRRAVGKEPEGCLSLRAYHEGGQVTIEISDDGAGIDIERIKDKAIKKQLVSVEAVQRMSDREILNMIFLPGFSTAEKVTNISGRGVGMDVVKTNIENIGGTVEIISNLGEGTTLKVKIPLTLAIIPALIVTSCGDQYAIPQVNLLELIRLDGEQAQSSIEKVMDAPVYRLRGNLLPLVYLSELLGLKSVSPHAGDDYESDTVNVVILQADDRQFGLVVDEINDTQEIVVKPLGILLKGIRCFAGATIKGDGKVALILDVMGLAQEAHVISEVRDRGFGEHLGQVQESAREETTLLLLESHAGSRLAIPLNEVARLEEFEAKCVEWAGDQEVVQYRQSILQLIRLSSVLVDRQPMSYSEEDENETLHVVVYRRGESSAGIVVDRILDVVEENLDDLLPDTRPGVAGTKVIQGRITQIINISEIVELACPSMFQAA